ncbi:MAG TPA: nucleotidyltransferase family protein [Steroidobacteraceae bacterium]
MILSDTRVPPPKTLQVALRKITDTLAHALENPTLPRPDWSDFEWVVAQAVAAMHGVSPLLSRSLLWNAPPGWTKFLENQRMHTARRYVRINAMLQHINSRSAEAGIAALALKGAALHAMGLYVGGERPMADVDLLVRPQDAQMMARVLESLGFRQSAATWKERIFTPLADHFPEDLGEHSDNDLKIELHDRICERLPWRLTEITADIFPIRPHAGLNDYSSKSSLMLHLLLHAAGSMPVKTLRLIQLHDIALLSTRMTQADWDLLLAYHSTAGRLWWAFPPLKLTSRYYPEKIPTYALTALADECPRLLRKVALSTSLSDVSYSYLWVDAFPGVAWSQSIPEVIDYAINRLRPSAQHLAAREEIARSESWARQDEWCRLSQARRIVRWISSRPTRPVTMSVVSAALGKAQ